MFKKNAKKSKKELKTTWQKVWYFIWDDDSLLSWIVNIVLAFILIKFVIYPGLGFVFGTSHPVVAVVSGSMEHKTVHPCVAYERYFDGRMVCKAYDPNHYQICGNSFTEKKKNNFDFFWETCGGFYEPYNLTKEEFERFPFKSGFNTGDIMVLFGKDPEKIKIGDVIVFVANQRDPIIHRVINKWQVDGKYYFQTKGDHNENSYSFESAISEDLLVGKAALRIPFLGNVKIWFVDLLRFLKLDTTLGRLFN
ncbi:MAG: signal peptidase I [Candidatus Woesearchaeota archaeon]|nr:signal peptidase I [Candidatus Woesearchaeota archaeon]